MTDRQPERPQQTPRVRGNVKSVILGPFWVVRHSLIDEVTGHLNDVNTLMMNLEKSGGGERQKILC